MSHFAQDASCLGPRQILDPRWARRRRSMLSASWTSGHGTPPVWVYAVEAQVCLAHVVHEGSAGFSRVHGRWSLDVYRLLPLVPGEAKGFPGCVGRRIFQEDGHVDL